MNMAIVQYDKFFILTNLEQFQYLVLIYRDLIEQILFYILDLLLFFFFLM